MGQAFVDYMAVKGIACKLQHAEGIFGVYVLHSEQAVRARDAFRQFAVDPHHPRYQAASWQRRDSAGVKFEYGSSGLPLLHNFLLQAGPVSLLVLSGCVGVFLFSLFGDRAVFQALQFFATEDAIGSFQQWRWITPALIHFSAVHLLFNCLWWWYLGGRLEHHESSVRLLGLFLFSALISNAAQFIVSGPLFGGLSGVVYALFGYFWVRGRQLPHGPLSLPGSLYAIMLLWMAFGFTGSFGPPMANAAHLVGLIAGGVQALVWRPVNREI